MASGTLTTEYKLFLSNIDTLATATQQAVAQFATKALGKALITPDNAEDAKNPHINAYTRASNLLQVLLTRVELNSLEFYTVCEILRSIPALNPMADLLNPSS